MGIIEPFEEIACLKFQSTEVLHKLFDRSLDDEMVGEEDPVHVQPVEYKKELRRCASNSNLYVGMNNRDTRSVDAEHDLFSKSQLAPEEHQQIQDSDVTEQSQAPVALHQQLTFTCANRPDCSGQTLSSVKNCNRLRKDQQALLQSIYFVFPYKTLLVLCELMGEDFVTELAQLMQISQVKDKRQRFANLDQKFRRTPIFKEMHKATKDKMAEQQKKKKQVDLRRSCVPDDSTQRAELQSILNRILQQYKKSDGVFVFDKYELTRTLKEFNLL